MSLIDKLKNLPTDAGWYLRTMGVRDRDEDNPYTIRMLEQNVADDARKAWLLQGELGRPKGETYASGYATDPSVYGEGALAEDNAAKRTLGQFNATPDGKGNIRITDTYDIDFPRESTDASLAASKKALDLALKERRYKDAGAHFLNTMQHRAVNNVRDHQEKHPGSVPRIDALIPIEPKYPGHTAVVQMEDNLRHLNEALTNRVAMAGATTKERSPRLFGGDAVNPPDGNFMSRSTEALKNFLTGSKPPDRDIPTAVDAPPAPRYSDYSVKPGDNLTAIAQNHGMSLDELLALNEQYRKNPSNVSVGASLRLLNKTLQ